MSERFYIMLNIKLANALIIMRFQFFVFLGYFCLSLMNDFKFSRHATKVRFYLARDSNILRADSLLQM